MTVRISEGWGEAADVKRTWMLALNPRVQWTLPVQQRLSNSGKALVLAAFAIAAVFLWETHREGPDFGHYFEWAQAARSQDIFELHADVLSRGGVPFNLAAAAPGMLFATTYQAARRWMEFRTAAYFTGWAAAMLFWVCAFAALRAIGRGSLALAAFGAGALFVGTHAGFYSFTYSSEVFASAFIAATWAIALCGRRGFLESAAVGAVAGLLLLVRPYLVLYALAPLWLVIVGPPDVGSGFSRIAEWRRLDRGTVIRLFAAAVPLVLAVIEVAVVNRWMTGSWFRPPYVYGGFGFQSMDLLHPQIGVVLAHPWRGLLVYHPLYGIAFLALLIGAWRSGPWRLLWAATVGVVLIHLWVQSAWHIWWLGGSFGMRGLAPAALPLVLALVALQAQDIGRPWRPAIWWVRVSLVACAWSFLLMLRVAEDNPYLTWSELMAGRAPAAVATGVLAALWVVVELCRARWNAPGERAEIAGTGLLLLGASTGYLISRTHGPPSTTLFLLFIAAVAAVCVFFAERLPGWNGAVALRVVCAAAVVLFAAQTMTFARLSARTERYLSSGAPPPRQFRSVGAVPLDDLRQNYVEYTNIPGFADRKRKLREYLNWLEIDAAKLAPADRALSERVLRAISDDPLAGAIFVAVTARNGVVHLASSDTKEVTRKRAVEVASTVPGVAAVEADMK